MVKINIKNLQIKYNSSLVVDDVSLSINPAEIVCLFGPSGCGKSTILKSALGILKPFQGSIFIDKYNSINYQFPISYMPQENELFRWLNVKNNIALWHTDSAKRTEKRTGLPIDEAIRIVELTEAKRKMPYELSGGMARRTALARCLSTHSSIMFLDEAFISVERRLRRKLMTDIRNHIKETKMTTILVSHDYEEATFMSDRIVFLTALPAQISRISDVHLEQNRGEDIFETQLFKRATIELLEH